MNKKGFERDHYWMIFVFLLAAVLGFVAGIQFESKSQLEDHDNLLEARRIEMHADINRFKGYFPSIPEIYSLFGEVISVSDGKIVIKTENSPNPFEAWPTEREVMITTDTEIFIQSEKEYAQYKQEIEQALANLKPGEFFLSPSFLKESEGTIFEIKTGDKILVYASKNIKLEETFEATKLVKLAVIAPTIPFPNAPTDLQ